MGHITDGNNLIAEFMGLKRYDAYPPLWRKGDKDVHRGDTIPYDTSWDWIMPVVDNIEGMGHPVYIFPRNMVSIKDSFIISSNTISNKTNAIKIMALWEAIIEFIKWYNQNK